MNKTNNEATEQMKILYNKTALAEKLGDLRKKKGLSLSSLSEAIETKTHVSISATQLCKYENNETQDIIGLNNLFALANFYDKSIYYLLGMNECETVDNEAIFKRLGFIDNTIKYFEDMKAKDIEDISIINILLGSKEISEYFTQLITAYKEYVKAISNNHLEIDISSFSEMDIQIEDDIEKINDYLKDKEYISLFKISEIAKRIAKHLKKKYDDSINESANSSTTGRKKK